VNAKGRTALDMLVYSISEHEFEDDEYSTTMCMPEAYSHCLTTPEKVILLSKNKLIACPTLLHGLFLQDFDCESWESILTACKECDGMAYFLVQTCPELLFRENSSGEMPFPDKMFRVIAALHNDFGKMKKSVVLANKPAIIRAYLEKAKYTDDLNRPYLEKRCSRSLESLPI